MKIQPSTLSLGSKLCLLAAPLLGACVHSGGGGGGSSHLAESEPNDGACCADYFGFLSAHEYLSIDGTITDSGFDPFDGFAFTAWEPITVEFRLHADAPFADLDICLYDPQLGLTVDCFESPFNPEVGVAHILSGGVDFHLVVNSFSGATGYTLEVETFPLHFAGAPALDGGAQGAVFGDGHQADEKPDRAAEFAAYGGQELAAQRDALHDPALIGLGELYLLDETTGDVSTAFLATTTKGTLVWMGNPDVMVRNEGR